MITEFKIFETQKKKIKIKLDNVFNNDPVDFKEGDIVVCVGFKKKEFDDIETGVRYKIYKTYGYLVSLTNLNNKINIK